MDLLKFKEEALHCGLCHLSSFIRSFIHSIVLDGGRKGSRDRHIMVSDHSFIHSLSKY